MNTNKSILATLALVALLGSCHKPDELVRENNENVMTLSVKATLLQNSVEYDAEIDDEFGFVNIYLPYYVSDTEEIMSDLSQIKIRATMPLGARFEPGLSGIHDLSGGKVLTRTLVSENGDRKSYTFRAIRKKSDNSRLASIALSDEDIRMVYSITEPAEEGGKGKLTVLKTSGALEAALESVKLVPAPWATVYAAGLDEETGTVNLNAIKEVIVISQDGVGKTVYEVVIDTPSLVPAGQIGYISNLFGVQCTAVNPMGFEADANCSMAAVDNYLIISNKNDFNRMSVYSRFSGRQLTDVTINTSGIDAGRELRAIGSDDDGHLVAATYTCTKEPTDATVENGWDYALTDTAIKIYCWRNGLQAAPDCIMDLDIKSDKMMALPSKASELFNMLAVKGSLSRGTAVITSTEAGVARVFAFYFVNGDFDRVEQFCPYDNGGAVWISTKNASKAVPMNTESPLAYVINGDFRPQIGWNTGTASGSLIFDQPTTHWWMSSGNYDYAKNLRGVDVTEFNGTYLIATSNGNLSNGIWAHRLYVSNVGTTPTKSSLESGLVFDSREGIPDTSDGGIDGVGFSASGMTSTYPFNSSDGVFGGTNATKRGDVIFVESADGNAVQVYMFTANAGILGYEITRYDM
ncbi:MAG: DUF5018 domain-containing protein [Candidatus Cryptobacteroides sp.]